LPVLILGGSPGLLDPLLSDDCRNVAPVVSTSPCSVSLLYCRCSILSARFAADCARFRSLIRRRFPRRHACRLLVTVLRAWRAAFSVFLVLLTAFFVSRFEILVVFFANFFLARASLLLASVRSIRRVARLTVFCVLRILRAMLLFAFARSFANADFRLRFATGFLLLFQSRPLFQFCPPLPCSSVFSVSFLSTRPRVFLADQLLCNRLTQQRCFPQCLSRCRIK